jgi:hypothetical protein
MDMTPAGPRPTLLVPLLEQTVLTLFSTLLVDGGRVAAAGLCASVAFWTGAFAICARRRREALSAGDRQYLNFGLLIAWLLGVPLIHAVWLWKRVI